MTPSEKLIANFQAARRVGTPLICVCTPDATSTMRNFIAASKPETPVIAWDIVRGFMTLNAAGKAALESMLDGAEANMLTNPVEALSKIIGTKEEQQNGKTVTISLLPAQSLVFIMNAHRILDDTSVMQAVWNMRDQLKRNFRTCVLFSTTTVTLPPEIEQDVIVLDEPLPSFADLAEIVKKMFKAAKLDDPSEEVLQRASSALIGLSSFAAEQVVAMSLTPSGLDFEALVERKCKSIEQTPGLSVHRGAETFEDVGGCENAKTFFQKIARGKRKPRIVVFFDEIEKGFAGAQNSTTTDTTTREMLGEILTWTEEVKAVGVIELGVQGGAKSLMAKALGNLLGVVTIIFNISAMKAGIVGETGSRLRAALKKVSAMAGGADIFMIATCNSIKALPPELRRRFKLGTIFFDLPDDAEKDTIWPIHCKKFGLDSTQPKPKTDGWTGAEIENCCDVADRMDSTLIEAAQYIVPVSLSAAEEIQALRVSAGGRYISASKPGMYSCPTKGGIPQELQPESLRSIELLTPDNVGRA